MSLSSPPDNRQVSLDNRNRRKPTSYIDFVQRVFNNETVLPERPIGPVPEYRKKGSLRGYIMDGYGSYGREPPLARSPTERTNWAGRSSDDGFRGMKNERDDGFRGIKNDRDRESFYRGRSPGTSHSITFIISPFNLSSSESECEVCNHNLENIFPHQLGCHAAPPV